MLELRERMKPRALCVYVCMCVCVPVCVCVCVCVRWILAGMTSNPGGPAACSRAQVLHSTDTSHTGSVLAAARTVRGGDGGGGGGGGGDGAGRGRSDGERERERESAACLGTLK